jgi:hypothetical protein
MFANDIKELPDNEKYFYQPTICPVCGKPLFEMIDMIVCSSNNCNFSEPLPNED